MFFHREPPAERGEGHWTMCSGPNPSLPAESRGFGDDRPAAEEKASWAFGLHASWILFSGRSCLAVVNHFAFGVCCSMSCVLESSLLPLEIPHSSLVWLFYFLSILCCFSFKFWVSPFLDSSIAMCCYFFFLEEQLLIQVSILFSFPFRPGFLVDSDTVTRSPSASTLRKHVSTRDMHDQQQPQFSQHQPQSHQPYHQDQDEGNFNIHINFLKSRPNEIYSSNFRLRGASK